MVAFTLHLILWIVCILFRAFVICWVCYGIYYIIKDKREWWLVDKHQKEAEEMEREEKWERVSKELKESWFSLDARKKELSPEGQKKIKENKKTLIIALIILAIILAPWIIISLIDAIKN